MKVCDNCNCPIEIGTERRIRYGLKTAKGEFQVIVTTWKNKGKGIDVDLCSECQKKIVALGTLVPWTDEEKGKYAK